MGSFIRCPNIGNSSYTGYTPEQIQFKLALPNPRSRPFVFMAPSALMSRNETVLTESLKPALFP